MPEHRYPDGTIAFCGMERFGRCRFCDLTDRAGPYYSEGYRRLFHPGEFPPEPESEPVPIPMPQPSGQVSVSPTEPGLFAKAVNLGKAIVTHTVAGLPRVDEATYETRLATCQACSSFDAERIVCLQCGCHLDVKLYWSDQVCPINKWGKAEPVPAQR